jgi:hypothetical protein
MPDPDKVPDKIEETEEESYYDEVRADIETSVYVFATLEEMDTALYGKSIQGQIKRAKENCIFIMCKGMETLRDGYGEE